MFDIFHTNGELLNGIQKTYSLASNIMSLRPPLMARIQRTKQHSLENGTASSQHYTMGWNAFVSNFECYIE